MNTTPYLNQLLIECEKDGISKTRARQMVLKFIRKQNHKSQTSDRLASRANLVRRINSVSERGWVGLRRGRALFVVPALAVVVEHLIDHQAAYADAHESTAIVSPSEVELAWLDSFDQ